MEPEVRSDPKPAVNVEHSDLASAISAQKKLEQKAILREYIAAFDSARPNTAEELGSYLGYLADGDFNIFVAKTDVTYHAATHARIVDTAEHGKIGAIEQIWHGNCEQDYLHAVQSTLNAIEWLRANDCAYFFIERVNPFMLADSPKCEGKRYSPGEESDDEIVLEAQLETRSLAQESVVLETLNQFHNIEIARIAAPYFQPDFWENEFSHGYFGLWCGSCVAQKEMPEMSRAVLDDYLESQYPDKAQETSFSRLALAAYSPDSNSELVLIPLSESEKALDFDRPLQELRTKFLDGEIDNARFESEVVVLLGAQRHL